MSDDQVAALSRQVSDLSKSIDKVLTILHNDEDTGTNGLVAEVREIKKNVYGFINQYQIDKAVEKGKATVWKIVWGAVGAFLLTAIKYAIDFFKHL